MAQLKVGQRVKVLSKSVGESYRTSDTCRYYQQGIPVYVNKIRDDGIIRVGRAEATIGGYFARKDLAPWNNLDESEEL